MAGFTAAVALASSIAGAGILLLVRPDGPYPSAHKLTGRLLIAVFAVALVILVLRRVRPAPPVGAGPKSDASTALLLTVTALIPLLLIPLYLLVRSTEPQPATVLYPYLDRRWIIATFLLGTLGVMLLLTAASRIVAASHGAPASWAQWLRQAFASPPASGPPPAAATERPSRRAVALRVGFAVAVGWYFCGPPWGLAANLSPVGNHETFQLGALQALDNGTTAYLGAASTQYGPGSQTVARLFMDNFGGYSVVGFRGAFALFNWLAATAFFLVLVLRLRFRLALVAIALAVLLFPTLQVFEFDRSGFGGSGTLEGFWGWFNALRYIGVIVAVMFLPVAVRSRRPLAAGAAVGVAWGLACYIAQENLGVGAIGIVALTMLLLLSRTTDARAMLRVLAGIAAGVAVVWLPVLSVYAIDGHLVEFARNYFLVPSAVSRGYSNTTFREGFGSDWGPVFYILPVLLAALGIAALVRTRPLRVATPWSAERSLLVAALVATVCSFTGAFLRSDQVHLINVTLSLPLLVVVVVAYLPRLLGGDDGRWRTMGSVGLAAVALLLIPLGQFKRIPDVLVSPLTARVAMADKKDPPPPSSGAAERMGPALSRARSCCTVSLRPTEVSMPELTRFLDRLHRVVGSRRTYVSWGTGHGMPGLIYFGARLRQPPLYAEAGTFLVDQETYRRFLDFFGRHIGQVDALVTNQVAPSAERDAFVGAYPRHRQVTLPLGGQQVFVLLRR